VGGSVKILVIEDDAPIRETLRDMLEISGFEVVVAVDGADGLDRLSQNPDLILCDLAMPRIDGFEVLATIRRMKSHGSLPIIVLTAKTERADLRRAMELGADDYITKPFSSREVLAAIDARLRRTKSLVERLEEYKQHHENQVAAAWSHELLTPLNGILGGSDLLLNDADTLSPAEVREIAQIIKGCGKREEMLARKILFHFELERQVALPGPVSAAVIDVASTVREVCLRLCDEANRLDDLKLTLAPGWSTLVESWLKMAVTELLENALKFSSSGTPIRVKGEWVEGLYRLEVENQGPAMTPDQIEGIGPFIQFNRRRMEQQGLGLGLSNIKKLARVTQGAFQLIPGQNGVGMTAAFSFPGEQKR